MPSPDVPDLKRQIRELGTRFPRLNDDALFVAWFLRAFATDDEETAARALTGGSRDKNVDGVLIDDAVRAVFVVQGKYRQSLMKTAEKRADVMDFCRVAHVLTGDEHGWETFETKLAADTKRRLQEARERLLNRDYRLQMCFATLGRCSSPLVTEARRYVRSAPSNNQRPVLHVLDGRDVIALLNEYLDGVAPPVPALDLPVESSGTVARYDGGTKIQSWVFSMAGDDVAALFRQAGVRLFARNIRGYLGDTKINKGMRDTLRKDPESFWYYNNGITIVCNEARLEQEGGQEVLNVSFPQIINGQQTTRSLAEAQPRQSAKATLPVRVISIPRHSPEHYERLVSQIVRATNWQNAIQPADLMSNDQRQIELEREFRKLNYLYVRKRQVLGEARAASFQYEALIKKEDLARYFAACLEEGLPRRVGVQPLFDEYYDRVFGGRRYSAKHYLCCYWHGRSIDGFARGWPEGQWAKYVVTYFVWEGVGAQIRKAADRFIVMCENPASNQRLHDEYQRVLRQTFEAVLRFYRSERGRGRDAIEVSPFFKRGDVYRRFVAFWPGPANASIRARFDRAEARFHALLDA